MEKLGLINSQYRNGILIPILLGISLFLIFFMYSRITSPESEVFLNDSLYSLAITVMGTFFGA